MENPSNAAPAGHLPENAGTTGPTNSIIDVYGIRVGQHEQIGAGYLTGTTVVHAPNQATAGVNVAGGAPGTRETNLLDPKNLCQRIHAIVLSGGSSYGLQSAYGVMQWLRERNEGFLVGSEPDEVVPIVPGAVIFDLGRGGQFTATPTAEFGYKAIANASAETVRQGTVGAGTGAQSGTLKGGVGTASMVLPGGHVVGALVVLNSFGNTINPATGRFYVEDMEIDGEFRLREDRGTQPSTAPAAPVKHGFPAQSQRKMNTTIAVVATNAPLSKAMAERMALRAQDGLAMAIRPVHTLYDGDTVFALSTSREAPLSAESDSETLSQVFCAAADTLARAVVHAVRRAESVEGMQSYRDTYPSACK